MEDILAPAIELGEKGFPVSELVAKAVRASNEPIRLGTSKRHFSDS
jgi:gamma-glutamyltranspeptidase